MRLESLQIRRAPGLRHELAFDRLEPGLNLVLGPNASGKSTFCRAARASLWPEETPVRGLEVTSSWQTRAGLRLDARLEGGVVVWSKAPPRLPGPEVARAYELSVRELMGAGSSAQVATSIAEQIARELAGGFDLPALARRFTTRLKPDHGKRQAFLQSQTEVARLAAAQDALAEREARLHEIERGIEHTKLVERARGPLETARRLTQERARLAGVSANLAELPAALEGLDGSELGAFDEDARRILENRRRLEENATRRARADQARTAHALPNGAVPAETVEAYRDRIDALAGLESAAAAAQVELAGLEAKRRDVAGKIWHEVHAEPRPLEPETIEGLERAVDRTRTLSHQRDAIEQQLARLSVAASRPSESREASLSEALGYLRRWLASPVAAPATPPPSAAAQTAFVLGAVGLVGLAVGGLRELPTLLALVAASLGAGLGLYLGARWPRSAQGEPAASERARFQADFARTGVAAPSSWTVEVVEAHLRGLEREHVALLGEARAAADAGAKRLELEAERDRLAREIEALAEQHRRWARELGLAEATLGLDLMVTARHLDRLGEYTALEQGSRARLAELQRSVEASTRLIAQFIMQFGGEVVGDATTARSALQRIRERSEALREAERTIEKLDEERPGLERMVLEAERRQSDRLAKTQIPGATRAHLEELIRRRTEHQKMKSELEVRRAEIARLEAELRDHPEIIALSLDEIDRRYAEAEHSIEARQKLVEERAEIQAKIEQAARGRSFEEAIARSKRAEVELAEDLELVLEGVTARLLVTHLESLYRDRNEPAVLARARAWFGRFTHHAFELDVTRDAGPRLSARDTILDEARSLEELSDGTRAQLLLAARMAHLGGAEFDEKLPFFLDEALSTTDDARFEVVAESLLEIAAEGRQVFYLSSNPADIEAWLRVAKTHGLSPPLIELAEPPRAGRPERERLLPNRRPEIPRPETSSPSEYARRLEVPEIDPEAPVASWHLYYVTHHDLDLLHAALERGLWTVGQWRRFERSPLLDAARFPASAIARVDAHIAVAESTHRLTRIGRGRRVPMEALEASGAVSETFMDAAREELQKEGGDAARVVAAVGSLPRFLKSKRDQLREYLVHEGYLDERPRYSSEELVSHVAEEVRSLLEGGIIASEDLGPLVRWYAEKSGWTPAAPVSYSA